MKRAHAADRIELERSRNTEAQLTSATARAHLQALVKKLEARGLKVVIAERNERLVVAVLPSSCGDPFAPGQRVYARSRGLGILTERSGVWIIVLLLSCSNVLILRDLG